MEETKIMASGSHFNDTLMANGNNGNSDHLFSCAPKSLQMVPAAMKLKDTCSLEGKLGHTLHIKKQRHHFADKSVQTKLWFLPQSCVDVRVGP